MRTAASSFYPPRANWLSKLRTRIRLIRLGLFSSGPAQTDLSAGSQLALALILPGSSFIGFGGIVWAIAGCVGYWLAFSAWVAMAGQVTSTVALALMLAIHATGLLVSVRICRPNFSPLGRYFITIAVIVPAYILLQRLLDSVVLPLRTREGTILINPNANPDDVKEGEIMAFRPVKSELNARDSAYAVSRVLAGEGSTVRFGPDSYSVDGRSFPSLPLMPNTGEWVIPPDHWFVWREVQSGADYAEILDNALVRAGIIPRDHFVGRLYSWWFWRNQYE